MRGLFVTLLIAGCVPSHPSGPVQIEVESFAEVSMGVDITVKIADTNHRKRLSAGRLAMAQIRACDEALSDWQASSERSGLPRTAGVRATVSELLFAATEQSIEIARATDGWFDPTIAPIVQIWRNARATGSLPDAASLDTALTRVGWQHVLLDAPSQSIAFDRDGMTLDFGGMGKGFAAQRASAAMVESGQLMHLVAVAGDLVAGPVAPPGKPGWTIHKEDGLGEAFELVLLGEAISTSGDLEQFIEIDGVRHSHIIDPRTGRALRDRTAGCVRGPDGATCDALATALCVAGVRDAPSIMRRFPGYRASVTTLEAGKPTTWSTSPGPAGPPCPLDVVIVAPAASASLP
ncbi:MAG: FAD:protein FMN transferase [Phycisphaerae bacterium]|nr:FAD:protein FMN transferase [Phycisphaerae bacterium]